VNETSINPISSVKPAEPGTLSRAPAPGEAALLAPRGPVSPEPEKSPKKVETEHDQAGNLSDVSIHFQVDDETNELTVFVVDRKTRRVLRSIPSSELHKLQAGDLLRLTA
jgi:hypothetical protein